MKMPWNSGTDQQIAELQTQVAHLQHLIVDDVSAAIDGSSSTVTGNDYKTYEAAVKALAKKYEGTADWGNQLTQNIVDVRAAFTMGSGVEIKVDDPEKFEREAEFVESFAKHNGLDKDTPQDWAREGEIEGRFLGRLVWNETAEYYREGKRLTGMVEVRYIPWTLHNYKVQTADDDYRIYTGATYKLKGSGTEIVLKPPEFSYARFGGRTHIVNLTTPKVGKILTQIESIDKALWDWRRINRLFASPTPYFKCDNAPAAKAVQKLIAGMNWRIGKALAIAGADFSLVGPPAGGVESLLKEITMLVKIVSGTTGVPVHFLGLPDLLSNRSTADNLEELVVSSTNKERQVWAAFYQDLTEKAIVIYSVASQSDLKQPELTASIPQTSARKLKELAEVWLPMLLSNAIDLQTFLEHVPELDGEQVMERLAEGGFKTNASNVDQDKKDEDKEIEEIEANAA